MAQRCITTKKMGTPSLNLGYKTWLFRSLTHSKVTRYLWLELKQSISHGIKLFIPEQPNLNSHSNHKGIDIFLVIILSSTVIMLTNPSLKCNSSRTNSTSCYWVTSLVACFPASLFLHVTSAWTLPSAPLIPHPPVCCYQNLFFKCVSNAISTNYLGLWACFPFIPLKGWNSSSFYPFSLETFILPHTAPSFQQSPCLAEF